VINVLAAVVRGECGPAEARCRSAPEQWSWLARLRVPDSRRLSSTDAITLTMEFLFLACWTRRHCSPVAYGYGEIPLPRRLKIMSVL